MRNNDAPKTSEVETFLTRPQAARYLGVHEETIWRWIKTGKLPAKRVGIAGHYRINPTDLDRMVRAA